MRAVLRLIALAVALVIPASGYGVAGGDPADPAAWTSTVALLDAADPNAVTAQFCAGTIVAPQWIVTAAHCVTTDEGKTTRTSSSIAVAAGSTDLSTVVPANIFSVDRLVVYPLYRLRPSSAFDIAMVHVTRPFPIEGVVTANHRYARETATSGWVAGWGSTDPALNTGTNRLLSGEISVSDRRVCSSLSGVANVMCGTFPESLEASACFGDSGGPLMSGWKRFDGSFEWGLLLGIVSAGPGNCGQGVTTLYTDVGVYSPWISMVLRGNRNPEQSLPFITDVTARDIGAEIKLTAAWCQYPMARRRVRVDFNVFRGSLARKKDWRLATAKGVASGRECFSVTKYLPDTVGPAGRWMVAVKVYDQTSALIGWSDDPVVFRVR